MKKLIISSLFIATLMISGCSIKQEGGNNEINNKDTSAINSEEGESKLEVEEEVDDVWRAYTDYELGFQIRYPRKDDYGTYKIMKSGDVVYIYDYSKESTINSLQERSNLSSFAKAEGIPFAILTREVNNSVELLDFIKQRYGRGCGIREISETETTGTYAVFIDGSTGNIEDCFINYALHIRYSPDKARVSAWDMGQAVNFSLNGEALDSQISDSFKFLP